jgi:hypothetical protein
VELEINPEPTEAERRAIAIALAEGDSARPVVYESAWRAAAIGAGPAEENAHGSEQSL